MARVMENHSKSLLPIPDVTSTTTRGFATQVWRFVPCFPPQRGGAGGWRIGIRGD